MKQKLQESVEWISDCLPPHLRFYRLPYKKPQHARVIRTYTTESNYIKPQEAAPQVPLSGYQKKKKEDEAKLYKLISYGCFFCCFYFFLILFTKSERKRGISDSATKILSFLFFLFAVLAWLNQPGNQLLEPHQYKQRNETGY